MLIHLLLPPMRPASSVFCTIGCGARLSGSARMRYACRLSRAGPDQRRGRESRSRLAVPPLSGTYSVSPNAPDEPLRSFCFLFSITCSSRPLTTITTANVCISPASSSICPVLCSRSGYLSYPRPVRPACTPSLHSIFSYMGGFSSQFVPRLPIILIQSLTYDFLSSSLVPRSGLSPSLSSALFSPMREHTDCLVLRPLDPMSAAFEALRNYIQFAMRDQRSRAA
ncbi:hypothetical protein BD626DRAFT_518607 [Schizophyllum amplum]|uniref:Uncharacterized protein n=1 Tax=Schizophyllum amplum TaxID=97359 RepID=A0A550BVT3_9AGAR|nr:hypothetical protein BD626DRAFT_518607 [Auriculariopsis ampla]